MNYTVAPLDQAVITYYKCMTWFLRCGSIDTPEEFTKLPYYLNVVYARYRTAISCERYIGV